MGCCLAALLLAGAPRLALALWWFVSPARVAGVFDGWFWLVAGFVLLPWTTIAYVYVAPGGITVLDWVILGVGLLLDVGVHGGGGRAYEKRRS